MPGERNIFNPKTKNKNEPGSPREKSMVSLISAGLKLEFAAGDPAGGLRRKS